MEYKIKRVDIDLYYNELLRAYYDFFEKMYGKGPISFIIQRRLQKGSKIPSSFRIIDSNFEYAQNALDNCESNRDIALIGSYDENDNLAAISRIRNVIEKSGTYICVSEILPLISGDKNIKTDVIKAIENWLELYKTGNYLSFEVPVQDIDFQNILLDLGYTLIPSKVAYPTLLFDKPLTRDISLN